MIWAAAVLVGCAKLPATSQGLPAAVAMVVERDDGAYASLVVSLARSPRHDLEVRVAEGIHLVEGPRVWSIDTVLRERDTYTLVVSERARGIVESLPLTASRPPDVLAMDDRGVWVDTGDDVVTCTLREPTCTTATDLPRFTMAASGPASGFRVEHVDGAVHVLLPVDGAPHPGSVVTHNARRLVALRWLRDVAARPALDRLFRGRGALLARPTAVASDGRLAEWDAAAPLVVDAAWQVERGINAWGGPRDASFSVAAAHDGDRVCLAGRVRDDHFTAGDRLLLHVGATEQAVPLELPLASADTAVRREWFGRRFEACFPLERTGPAHEVLRFNAALHDHDPDEPETVLGAAPGQTSQPVGRLRLQAAG